MDSMLACHVSTVQCTSGLAIRTRMPAAAACIPVATPNGLRVVVHAMICGHELVVIISSYLHTLAHMAPNTSAPVVGAWVCVTFHATMPTFHPPAMHCDGEGRSQSVCTNDASV